VEINLTSERLLFLLGLATAKVDFLEGKVQNLTETNIQLVGKIADLQDKNEAMAAQIRADHGEPA
jgi:hypothetical protein